MGLKRCFKCGVERPIEDFYRHPQMGDGHLNKCKDCTKRDMCNDRHTKPRVRQYDRERAALPHRKALRERISKAWAAKYPERRKAHQAVNNAMRTGKIQKPTRCEGCGLEKPLEKHHHDYSKPLAVIWLCKTCHAIADKLRRRLEAS